MLSTFTFLDVIFLTSLANKTVTTKKSNILMIGRVIQKCIEAHNANVQKMCASADKMIATEEIKV